MLEAGLVLLTTKTLVHTAAKVLLHSKLCLALNLLCPNPHAYLFYSRQTSTWQAPMVTLLLL